MSLLDTLTRGYDAAARRPQPWPPPAVKKEWDRVKDFRDRYENDRAKMINSHPSLEMQVEMRETFIPVPLPREICKMSSSLLFSTSPSVTSTEFKDELKELILVSDFGAFCIEGGVNAACEGRTGIRILRDPVVSPHPLLTHVAGDQVVWDIRHGDFIVGGVVVAESEVTTDKGSRLKYRLFEEHTPGWVRRELYVSDNGNMLGRRVPLNTLPEYANLEDSVATGLDKATLIPWDNIPGAESDLFGLGSMFDELNEAETWLLDAARKGVPRLFVDRSLLDEGGRANGINGIIPIGRGSIAPAFGADPSKMVITSKPEFNASAHILFMAHTFQMIVTMAGYSPLTWGIQGQTANVTREVSGYAMKLAQLRTLLTRSAKEHMALQSLGWALAIALAWDLGESDCQKFLPTIELGDGLPSDPLDGAQEVQFLRQAAAASTPTLVGIIHPTWDDARIQVECDRILEEAISTVMASAGQGVGPLTQRVASIVNSNRGTAGDGTDSGASPVD